jgi:hypothetical protein
MEQAPTRLVRRLSRSLPSACGRKGDEDLTPLLQTLRMSSLSEDFLRERPHPTLRREIVTSRAGRCIISRESPQTPIARACRCGDTEALHDLPEM